MNYFGLLLDYFWSSLGLRMKSALEQRGRLLHCAKTRWEEYAKTEDRLCVLGSRKARSCRITWCPNPLW
jgi:hypothetical protein